MVLGLSLVLFWAMQIVAQLAFKWGSGDPRRWRTGFLAGNLVGATSILALMRIYALLPQNSNLAAVLAGSGGFIGGQLLLAKLFHSRLSPRQWVGIALVAVGTAVATLGGPTAHA